MGENALTSSEKIDRVLAIINGKEEKKEEMIGIELEHFVIDQKTKKRVFYQDQPVGVGDLLEEISQLRDFEIIENDGFILGMACADYTISIEPGAQFEISVTYNGSILELMRIYRAALCDIAPILDKYGLSLISLGTDPINKVDQIPIIPRERYRIMNEYLQKQGQYAQAMMRQSCALQVTLDFHDEADFVKKYRVLTALTPILYTLFDNAYALNGEIIQHFNMRQEIWQHMDDDRSGIIPGTFDEDFGFASYAQWVLDCPPLFYMDGDEIFETGQQTTSQLIDQMETEEEIDALIRQAMSIVFPDIRLKQYLEVRVMDAVPEDYAFGAAALIKGLFYHPDNLEILSEEFSGMTENIVNRGKDAGKDYGIRAYYYGKYMGVWGLYLIELARRGLDEFEQHLLDPLQELWNALETPRTQLERSCMEVGQEKAYGYYQIPELPC